MELSGILGTSDNNRLRLCLVNSIIKDGKEIADYSWKTLVESIPSNTNYKVPYKKEEYNTSGIIGECYITLNSRDKKYKERILNLAQELRGKYVKIIVNPKRYSLVSNAYHNKGETITGTMLNLQTIERLN